MATVKLTITLDEEQLRAAKAEVKAGRAENVSAFVRKAVRNLLLDTQIWGKHLEQRLEESGGPPTKKEIQWADRILGGQGEQVTVLGSARRPSGPRSRRRAA